MEDDKQYLLAKDHEASNVPYSPRRSKYRSLPTILNMIIFVGGVATWAHVNVLVKSLYCNPCPEGARFEQDLLYNSKVTFQPHWYMGGPPSNKTDEMWERLSPPGDGIVEIPNEYTANLPKSLPAPHNPDTHTVYGISMFHQLHCLNFLRFAYWPDTVEDMPAEEVAFHRDHCLDYIRQGIMCAGDATFEPLTEAGINGMGATHQCRDFDKLFAWGYSNRSNKKSSGYTHGRITHTPGQRNHLGGVGDDDD
ncbi:uncharacterized protein SEPMUDRAFT_44288 [Sphaerulina musiva SO2202]|uniref:Oxidase ustYa n=1 Tax=Sphaerulina musiva (strain SO2202) TaxID=692275 RepID=M3BXA6_SPHMS|nr:uncharacterized protein SEPMUDRAFT_44288 [Sphaerulina musiva SO2202]EMF12706.1 hypothetical protein SEPMUDRAFT_44288 [Sphaerulina musiva SO2202]